MARDWDTLSKEFTKEELDETKALLDNFIAKVNEQVEAGIKAEEKKDDTPKTGTTKANAKITRENINVKWPEIEKNLSDPIKKSSASYLEMARDWDTLSKEFTKEELDETKALLDNFIAKVNEQVEAGMKGEIPDVKKPEKPVKPKYKVGDFVITTDSKEHDAYYKIITIDTDKNIYLVTIFDIKTNEPRVAESPITFTTAGLKKYTPKPYVPKVAEAPAWLKTLRSFVNMVGKEKPVSSIRKLVLDIQDRFDAKRGKHTNHIELIREIQDKLIPYANKKADKKVTLPEWKDLTDRCKVAIKSVSVSTKLSKDDVTSIELSGHRK